MSIGISVNREKNGILLAYIAGRIPNVHLRKLLKIVYLIDEHFMKGRGFPLTWFDYYAWAKGPVAPEVYDIKNGAFGEFVASHRSLDDKCVVNSVCDANKVASGIMSSFSEYEITEIDKLISDYGALTAYELSDLTHQNDSVWTKVVSDNGLIFDKENTRSNLKINFKMLFAADDSRIDTYGDAIWNMELQARLLSNRNPQNNIQLQVISPSEREKYVISGYSPVIP